MAPVDYTLATGWAHGQISWEVSEVLPRTVSHIIGSVHVDIVFALLRLSELQGVRLILERAAFLC